MARIVFPSATMTWFRLPRGPSLNFLGASGTCSDSLLIKACKRRWSLAGEAHLFWGCPRGVFAGSARLSTAVAAAPCRATRHAWSLAGEAGGLCGQCARLSTAIAAATYRATRHPASTDRPESAEPRSDPAMAEALRTLNASQD